MAALVCPKKVKVGASTFKVSASNGSCFVRRKDGTKAPVKKVERGHKGFGQFARSSKAAGRGPSRKALVAMLAACEASRPRRPVVWDESILDRSAL